MSGVLSLLPLSFNPHGFFFLDHFSSYHIFLLLDHLFFFLTICFSIIFYVCAHCFYVICFNPLIIQIEPDVNTRACCFQPSVLVIFSLIMTPCLFPTTTSTTTLFTPSGAVLPLCTCMQMLFIYFH
eukprot:m.125578 g.125578  ORF g.125578 m.125578 type:complete len:126 (-) comp9430_c2_seq2:369-746(-)